MVAKMGCDAKPESHAHRRNVVLLRFGILALAGALLSAQEPGNTYTKAQEAALGAALAWQVREHMSALDDSAVHAYIARLGEQLALKLPGGNIDWDFAVIRDNQGGSTHEAPAFPAGHVFIPASLILAAEGEAELAGMLAHSMDHVAERHATRLATRSEKDGIAIPLIVPNGTDPTMVHGDLLRGFELDADDAAVKVLAAAGYDPAALLDYVRRTQRRSTTARYGMYSPLPPREERISALETALAGLPRTGLWSSSEFAAVQARVRELTAPLPVPPKLPPTLFREDER
jgi:predicted Zn-dependent protease